MPILPYYRGVIQQAQMNLSSAWWSGDMRAVEAATKMLCTVAPREGKAAENDLETYRRLTTTETD